LDGSVSSGSKGSTARGASEFVANGSTDVEDGQGPGNVFNSPDDDADHGIGAARAYEEAGGRMKLIGIVLIVLGVLGLAYGGFSYTTRERVVDLGPLKVDADKEHTVPIAPIAGVAALVGGIALVMAGSKTRV
jgi:hypothetical protein